MKKKKFLWPAILLILVPAINYLGSLVSQAANLPLFLDSLGTVLGVILGGFWIGAIGGAAYNIILAFASSSMESSIWALSSILIALIVWGALKSKRLELRNYARFFEIGLVLAAANSILTAAISFFFFKGAETFPAAIALQKFFASFIPNEILNIFAAHFSIEIVDKSLIFLLVFGIYKLIEQKKSLSFKKIALPAAVLIVVVAFTALVNVRQNISNEKLEQDLLIKSQTQQAASMLETVYEGYKDGMYSFDQAKTMGASLLRNLRYGDQNGGYFWADTSDGTNVVLYGRKDVEGKNRIDSYVGGVYHVREIIANGKKPGGGFTDYFFTRKDGEKPLAKRGFSLYFEPFDWILGTGYYIEDLKK